MGEQTLKMPVEKTAVATLSGVWLQAAQVVWIALAVMALVALVAALPGYAAKFGGQLGHATGSELPPGSRFFATASGIASLASTLLSLGLSTLLFRRKFSEPMAALLSFFLLFYGIVFGGPLEFAADFWLGSGQIGIVLQGLLIPTPLIALLLLFPNGRFVPHKTRWLLLLLLPWNVALLWLVPFDAASLGRAPLVTLAVTALFVGFALVGLSAQVYRYRRAATYNERQQIRWALYGFALWIGYVLIATIPYFYLSGLPQDAPTPWWGPASELIWWLSLSILPLSLTIAITRYKLWNIDLVINRTLVYGALTAVVFGLYGLLVGGMGAIFQIKGSWLATLVITGVVAVLFQPLRTRLQRGVNRLMYGERDEPFEVLARLGERLEASFSPEMVYPTIVETVSQALKLPYTAVAVPSDSGWQTVQAHGQPPPRPIIFPLTYQGETVGQLRVAPRSPGESFSPADERLLRNVARQAGASVHAVQLMDDLQKSRQQLVTAREEERRRLRRDLHDGLGPQLASQMLTIDAIGKLLDRDPERAQALLHDLKTQSKTAVQDIRRVVYNLRPPALDELGLVGALEESAMRHSHNGLVVTVESSQPLSSLPAAVEVAAFRFVQEALANVVHHAGASQCRVELVLDDSALSVSVSDNGHGLPLKYRPGVGLHSMRERAAELGGSFDVESNEAGVRVIAVLPVDETNKTSRSNLS